MVWKQSYLLVVLLAGLSGMRVTVIGGQAGLEILRVNLDALDLLGLVSIWQQD